MTSRPTPAQVQRAQRYAEGLYRETMSITEFARELGIPAATARSWVFRGSPEVHFLKLQDGTKRVYRTEVARLRGELDARRDSLAEDHTERAA